MGMVSWNSLIDTTGEEAAVYGKNVAGDEAGCVGREKHGGAGEFFELSEATHWRTNFEFLAAFRSVEKIGVEFGAKYSGSDGVDANAFAGPFDGERFGERCDGGLACGISGDFVESDKAGKRSDINDAAVAAFDHVAADDAAGAKRSGEVGFDDCVPFGIGKVNCGSSLGAACRVHENLDATKFSDGRGE